MFILVWMIQIIRFFNRLLLKAFPSNIRLLEAEHRAVDLIKAARD